MPVFEVEANGKTFEVDAPDMSAASAALKNYKPEPAQEKPVFSGGLSQYIPSEITDIPKEIVGAGRNAINAFNEGTSNKAEQGAIGGLLSTGRAVAAIPELAFSPITGAARSVGGHLLARAERGIGGLINPGAVAKESPDAAYEAAKGGIDQAMMALRPSGGGSLRAPGPAPTSPVGNGPLGVTLSQGQATRDLAAIQREQAALRAPQGRAGQNAQDFAAQQSGEVAAARDRISQGFDPFNQKIVDTPQEAGQLVQQSIQREAANRKASVNQLYENARSLPGEIPADTVKAIGDHIKLDLSSRPEPIVIDDKLTPYASHAIRDIETRISNLQVQNRAHPLGQPPQNQISGITLEELDQQRKRLVTFRNDAYRSGNASDGRAARGVIDAYDNFIDSAVNSGAFTGDPLAVKAWNTARAAHADYRATFGKQGGDPVGRVVERILGTKNNPAAIPNDVADFIYGGSGVNPNSLNVAVANRIKGILGEWSPEWSAVRQGLFQRLVETPAGAKDMGPGTIANRISKFLADGRELAEAVYSPFDRSLIKQYGELHRALEVPQAGAQWSNNLPYLKQIINKVSSGLAAVIGGVVAHYVAPGGLHGVAEAAAAVTSAKIGGAIKGAGEARQIAKQMPLIVEATRKFQKALTAYNKANTPPSGAALQVATANLARSLRHVGIDLSLEAPAVGRADDQQGVPRPPGQ